MKLIVKYFFMALIILQGFVVFCYFTHFNFLGLLTWIGEPVNWIKFFLPLIVYGGIKVLFWFANPLSKLFTIILNWAVIVGIIWLIIWIFFM